MRKRKHAGEGAASPSSPTADISNTSMSTSSASKEEHVKAIKREDGSSSWNPAVDISNTSMSSSSISKEDHSQEEQPLAIKKEDDA